MSTPADAQHGAIETEARALAAGHVLADRRPRPIAALGQLRRVAAWLVRARGLLGETESAVLAKAAEWLLDNEYLVVRAVRQIEQDLPPGFYARLPSVGGPLRGRTRIWSIARDLLRVSRLQLSVPTLTRFLDAYQEHAPLTIGELWALPTFLRLGCLEVLFAAFERLDSNLQSPLTLEDMPDPGIERTECVGRAISNLRTIAAISWKDFFCRTSRVEAILREDPARQYARMDFETRDTYRRAVEQLAARSPHSELQVAERAVAWARQALGGPLRPTHVGHWLIDAGVEAFERSIGYQRPFQERVSRWCFQHAALVYALALLTATIGTIVLPVWYLVTLGTRPLMAIGGLLLVLLPGFTLAVTVVLWLTTTLVPPRILPKLDFAAGIPDECRAAVVMPTLVGSAEEARRQVERLELHYLGNPEPTTPFVLLSDFPDASREHEPADDEVLTALVAEVRRLNQKYPARPFHVLHRPRLFNAAEDVWMAWERKRGKLEQFNRLLGGDPQTNFTVHEGERGRLAGIRYVVTLDLDTVLPKGTLARLVGTLAHPLNRPEFGADGGVHQGYTVIQPRVEISPECGSRSRFARWFTGDTTIDIYSRAVSDVYQDVFGSGIYIGKGAYDVDAFRRSLEGRVPENALASHDLFEGIHGRAALATDIVLYEGFPRQYLEFTRRQHRWIRGDWQLLPWLWRTAPGAEGRRLRNRLAGIDRWKIADNLRRSLLSPALIAMLIAGWLFLPGHPVVWTILGALAPAGHIFTDLVTGFARGRRRSALAGTLQRLSDHAGRWLLLLVFLPYDAAVAADAITRTLVRVLMTRRHLLQWTSAAHTSEQLANGRGRRFLWREMWIAPALAVVALVAVLMVHPRALVGAWPLLVMWAVAPEVAYALGRPRWQPRRRLDADDRILLRRVARRTWRYFEVFAGPEDQWLPPDNFQEQPRGEVAHRTSPTNIGMMFLSTLAAYDLGYLGLDELAVRLRNSLETLARLERYRGHLFNWYDTRTLEPLTPRYVSTVDSGNLAMSLLTLKEGCLELAGGPALRSPQWCGVADIVRLLDDAMGHLDLSHEHAVSVRRALDAIDGRLQGIEIEPTRWWSTLHDLLDRDLPELDRRVVEVVTAQERPTTLPRLREFHVWLERLHHHVRSMNREYGSLMPWAALLTQAPAAVSDTAAAVAAVVPPTLGLAEFADRCRQAHALATTPVVGQQAADDSEVVEWRAMLSKALDEGERTAGALRALLLEIAGQAEALALAMDFSLVYDKDLRLFNIGYNVTADRLDPHHYDLLASEARLASLFAIAKGDVPVEHWFHLGRATTVVGRDRCLLSWGGSMFEYLMPRLLVRSERGSLIAESERVAIDAQQRYGRMLGIPWGMSESGLSATDSDHTYQYRSFGVPGLGLRRGLATEAVIAPYASVLALTVDLGAALSNLRRLEELGLVGEYGFYEAADFTPDRTPAGCVFVPVLSYMAHHQGMLLAALDNAVCDDVLVRRTEADRRVRSVALLLHERVPIDIAPEAATADTRKPRRRPTRTVPRIEPWIPAKAGAFPEMHLLGNGRLATWISDAGAGALRWQEWNLTRWRADATTDDVGIWIYVRDEETGAVWSAARQPCGAAQDAVDVIFYPHLAEFHRRDGDLGTRVEVVVAPTDDIEIRRVTIINDGDRVRRLTLTTYGEVTLAPAADHERHPAFSKLFVHSEFIDQMSGLVFERRPRRPEERPPVLLHRFVSDDPGVRLHGIETDRAAFLGRGRTVRDPEGSVRPAPIASGFTLDPILALRITAEVEPNSSVHFAFVTAVAGSRESALDLAGRYETMTAIDWVMTEAETEGARVLQRLGIEPNRMSEIQTLASLLVYRHRALRCSAEAIAANHLGQPRLWGLGLSGDLPILLVKLRVADDVDFIRDVARAHALWRRRGLRFDLVALRHGVSGYEEPVGEKLRAFLHGIGSRDLLGQRGGIRVLSADHIGEDDRRLLDVAANVVLDTAHGSLAAQLARVHEEPPGLPRFLPGGSPEGRAEDTAALEQPAGLVFDNTLGGFTADGREYVIRLREGETTPAPWCNVLANPEFGTLVTESGGGFSWAGNSGEHRVTPWTNDPVSDPPGEAIYIRDEETAAVWTPTPRPAGAGGAHEVRYGAGYARWRAASHGLSQELLVFVAAEAPVKVLRLHVQNHEHRPRRLTVTYYVEWLLAGSALSSNAALVTEYEPSQRAILAWNPWHGEFADRVAFVTCSRKPHGITSDRAEFIGREGTAARPAALERWGLTGTVQAGRDPCAAFQVHLDVPSDAEDDVVFVLGEGRNRNHALELVATWREPATADAAWEQLAQFWNERLDAVHVDTPEPATNIMLNRWLLYQATASRMFGRTGFYQSSGAIGFRDQLQDALALLLVEPGRCRSHLLNCAARQFDEGDVLHWWHPPAARGVRTRCSDDLLWLPFAVTQYVLATGDTTVLDEPVPFLKGRPLLEREDDLYAVFEQAGQSGSLFEHCERALEHGVTRGAHGLPLIGSGDWNDGMNRVGRLGRGESVWLAWFAIATMNDFAKVCQQRKAGERAERWRRRARELSHAVEEHGWDGNWYRRAFDDDGRPLGSHENAVCRIDSIAQSWAVLSGAGSTVRAMQALCAVERELIDVDQRLVRLLAPPFTEAGRDPGYIGAYPPGIRENGGQYTHAAIWVGWAFADLGDGDRAARVFDLLNPIGHASNLMAVRHYRVEPYVVAADIGGMPPYVGRGGWTWYTGSAAWLWRLGIERLVGVRPEDGGVRIEPCLPRLWRRVDVTLRRPAGTIAITIENPDGVSTGVVDCRVDGWPQEWPMVAFPTDGRTRHVTVRLGPTNGLGSRATESDRTPDVTTA